MAGVPATDPQEGKLLLPHEGRNTCTTFWYFFVPLLPWTSMYRNIRLTRVWLSRVQTLSGMNFGVTLLDKPPKASQGDSWGWLSRRKRMRTSCSHEMGCSKRGCILPSDFRLLDFASGRKPHEHVWRSRCVQHKWWTMPSMEVHSSHLSRGQQAPGQPAASSHCIFHTSPWCFQHTGEHMVGTGAKPILPEQDSSSKQTLSKDSPSASATLSQNCTLWSFPEVRLHWSLKTHPNPCSLLLYPFQVHPKP